MNGLGTNLFHAFRLWPPSVPTEPVSTCRSMSARAGCHPPRFPDALPRHRCEAKRAACGGDFARDLDDDFSLDSAFFFSELRGELRVVLL